VIEVRYIQLNALKIAVKPPCYILLSLPTQGQGHVIEVLS
jgi:hypothetical protein